MMGTRSFPSVLVGLAGACLSAGVYAQGQPAQPDQQPQPQTIYPTSHPPLGGVPAQAPGPVKVGGVPDNGPPGRQIPIVPPPAYQVAPPAPSPGPGHGPIDDHTRRDLLRRYYAAWNGNVTYVNGWPYTLMPSIPVDGYTYGPYYRPGWAGGTYSYPVISPRTGSIHGYYDGNNWRLAFHLGGGYPVVNYRSDTSWCKYPMRMYRSYYAPWEDAARYASYGWYDDPYLIVGTDDSYLVDPRLLTPGATVNQPQAQPQPPRELTSLEKAEMALRSGDAAQAVQEFKLHLKDSPDDAGVERLLAVALVDERRVDQAVAVMIHAYTKQPQLARDPIDPRSFAGGELDHRRRFTAVMEFANRTRTSSGLFAACVMAQSEGRVDVARKLLERATAAGLDARVAVEMTIALSK